MRKLERDSLYADRAAVRAMLDSLEATDPVGRLSFESRLREIDEELARLGELRDTLGSVALMFNGDPVRGSRSIDAEFASEALKTFQDLISKRIATEEFGMLGARGPIPGNRATNLAITEIVRGSMGFLLEERAQNEELDDSAVKVAIDDVAEMISRTASENLDDFESAVESLDGRLLVSLRHFFRNLDENGATLRLVEGERDATLDSAAVHRARERIDTTEIEERESRDFVGVLRGLLPEGRRFEMRLVDTGELISGAVAAAYAARYLELIEPAGHDIVGRVWRAHMRVRVVRERNKPPRNLYTLIGLIEQVRQLGGGPPPPRLPPPA